MSLEKKILESAGYEVELAFDGLDGLEKVANYRPDLIVADIKMPRLDGFQMTNKLKQDSRYKDIPIIILTSLEKDEERCGI